MRCVFPVRDWFFFSSLRFSSLLYTPSIRLYTCTSTSSKYSGSAIGNKKSVISNTHTSLLQFRSVKMSTSSVDAQAQEVVDRLGEPASKEAEILEKHEGREEALNEIKTEEKKIEKKEEKKEEALPKLSAADFKIYNSMADHMEYFVGFLPPIFSRTLTH